MKISDEAYALAGSVYERISGGTNTKTLKAAAELIQSALDAEREACARICEDRKRGLKALDDPAWSEAERCEISIMASISPSSSHRESASK